MLGRGKKKTEKAAEVEATIRLEGKDVDRVRAIQMGLRQLEEKKISLARNLDFILAGYVGSGDKVKSINTETGEIVLAEAKKDAKEA